HGVWRSVEGAAGWRVVVRFPAGPRSQGACALFPYTPLFRSQVLSGRAARALAERGPAGQEQAVGRAAVAAHVLPTARIGAGGGRSEEHTSELQSREKLVCRLLIEKKKARSCVRATAAQASNA